MSIKINHPINPAPTGEQTWSTEQLQAEFRVRGFGGGAVFVTRIQDGQHGCLAFDGSPRLYHTFTPSAS